MADLYSKPGDINYRKDRVLSVFSPEQLDVLVPGEEKIDAVPVFDRLKEMIDRAEEIVTDLAKVSEAFSIPISEDDAQIRAAHTQLGGDGISIKFQEYAAAIEEHQANRGDYLNEEFNGLGAGDMAKIRRGKYDRAVKNRDADDDDLDVFDQLAGYGANAVLLYLLGEQIAFHTSQDTAQSVAAKYPPATEAGAILMQIVQALLMLQALTGMTEDAMDEYQKLGDSDINLGFDVSQAFKDFKANGPQHSRAYGFYRSQMASQNHELLLNYSVSYCAQNIGKGYESWLAYLGVRSTHEEGLRSYYDGAEYRSGELELGEAHKDVIENKTAGGQALMDMVTMGLGRRMDWGETCCLLRFLDLYTPNILEIMRAIIQMALASLNWQVQQAYEHFLGLANHPWNVISERLVKWLDKLFDKITGELLDAMEIDNSTFEILKACTPIGELLDFLLSAVVDIQNWYHNMIRNVGISIDKSFRAMTVGWQTTFKIRRAQELLMAIDEMLEKAQIIGELREGDNLISGLVGKLSGSTWAHDLPGAEAVEDVAGFTESALDWCRKIGDWDYIRTQVGSLNTEVL